MAILKAGAHLFVFVNWGPFQERFYAGVDTVPRQNLMAWTSFNFITSICLTQHKKLAWITLKVCAINSGIEFLRRHGSQFYRSPKTSKNTPCSNVKMHRVNFFRCFAHMGDYSIFKNAY